MPLMPATPPQTRSGPFDDVQDAELVPERSAAPIQMSGAVEAMLDRINNCPWAVDEDGALSIAMQTLGAGTAAEVGAELEGRTVTKLGLSGHTMQLSSFTFSESSFRNTENDCPVFANVTAVNADGQVFFFAIGGWGPVSQLIRWFELNAFPVNVRIIEIPAKTAGRNPAFRFVIL